MRLALRVLLGVLGASAVLICGMIMALGPARTALAFEGVYGVLTGYAGPPSPDWPPTMDSELRFYAPFWGAYGLLLLFVAHDLAARGRWVPWLAGLFFLAGAGRVISLMSVGAPHPFFQALTGVELLLPPVLVALWVLQRRIPKRPGPRGERADRAF